LAKALVLRTHAKGYDIVQLLVNLLKDEKWGMDAARAFQAISSEDDLLNKSNHVVIRLLHKQRIFMFVFPQIVSTASSQGIDTGSPPIPSFNWHLFL
jgi:DNA repair/transcription protein MET18/MMS19